MSPSDIYHGAGYRCSILRQERLSLNLERYMALDMWFGKMPIGIQLGDFFQLRPTAQKSLVSGWMRMPWEMKRIRIVYLVCLVGGVLSGLVLQI